MEYQGYPSWNAWNVVLWINNDEWRYREARRIVEKYGEERGARHLSAMWEGERTPDGGRYNLRTIRLAIEGICE